MNFQTNSTEDLAETQPTRPGQSVEEFQPVHIQRSPKDVAKKRKLPLWIFLFMVPLIYFFAPFRTNFLVLGIDGGLSRGELGRTDTIILGTISPLRPYVGLLSIPRDLWVPIPSVGENRINTAYFFAEAEQAGSGPGAAMETVQQNFHVPVSYYIILHMDGLLGLVDALGGIDIQLSSPMAGYGIGTYHLNGVTALAFVRSRAGADDFSRMSQGQILLKAVAQRLLQRDTWTRLPEIIRALNAAVDMNIPYWQWPRLALAILRAGPGGIDSHTITREMVHPFTTSQGAQVLGPDWGAIGDVVKTIFGNW